MFFYTVRIKTTHKPSKVAAVRIFFSIVHVIDETCFDDCFLFHAITLYFMKVWCYFAFFETSFLKEINQGHRHWGETGEGGAPVRPPFSRAKKNFLLKIGKHTLREKCPNTEFFLVRIFPHGEILRISPYSAQMRVNTE